MQWKTDGSRIDGVHPGAGKRQSSWSRGDWMFGSLLFSWVKMEGGERVDRVADKFATRLMHTISPRFSGGACLSSGVR